MLENKFVIVDGADDVAGATTWWRLRAEVPRADMQRSVQEPDGLDAIALPVPEPEVALRRAVAEQRERRRLVRTVSPGVWAVVDEAVVADRGAATLRHAVTLTVQLDAVGRLRAHNHLGSLLSADDDARVGELMRSYQRHLVTLTPEDLSAWLIDNARRLDGVSLRPGGGIYYLPPRSVGRWRALTAALAQCSVQENVALIVPTIRMTVDGASAILEALTQELADEVTRLRREVISAELGPRALETRAARAQEMLRRVERYEQVVDRPTDLARELIDNLNADITAAKLAAQPDEPKRGAS